MAEGGGAYGVPLTPPGGSSDGERAGADGGDGAAPALESPTFQAGFAFSEGPYASYQRHVSAPECLEPYRYICKSPGKNVRAMMIDCFQKWFHIPSDKISVVKQIVGLLHNASLLVDDIEDDSKLRRGQPVAHKVYGVPQTLNCANYVYFLAMEKCLLLQNAKAMQVFTTELLNLHRGQGRELFWRDNSRIPTQSEYEDMVKDKTGGLFRLGVGLMQVFATQHLQTNFTPLVDLLAIYFQVRDDLINLASKEYQKNKSFCEDLSEGKYSFPILHGIRNSPKGNTQIVSILKQRTENIDLKLSVVKFLRSETFSFRFTKEFLDKIYEQIQSELASLGGSPDMIALMQRLQKDIDECDIGF